MLKKVLLAALASFFVSPTLLALNSNSEQEKWMCPAVCYYADSTVFVTFKFKKDSTEEEIQSFLSKLRQPLQSDSNERFDNIVALHDGRYSADYHPRGCYSCRSKWIAQDWIEKFGRHLVEVERVGLRAGSGSTH